MRQRIVISGLGGQGVLTLTRVLAEAALLAGHEVITSETHGMAQRGGAVLSTVKVGPFHGPLLCPGEAEIGLFLHAENLAVHGGLLHPAGSAFLNGSAAGSHPAVDATRLAAAVGAPRAANLALLGFAAGSGRLFADCEGLERAIAAAAGARHLQGSLAAFHAGLEAWR
ncbi:MAG: 2-oxoacid:acceptor oxidoreductase family protein [Candidatus Methylomirabilales bacterium]